MIALIWAIYIIGVIYNLWVLRRIDIRRLDFIDGILIGQAYYIILPMAFILLAGVTSAADLHLSYMPFRDLRTTTVLFIGLFLLPSLRLLLPKHLPGTVNAADPRFLTFVMILFFASTTVTFFMVGLHRGGGWMAATSAAFEDNPLIVVIKQAANFSRTAVFGLLLHRVVSGKMTKIKAMATGLFVALFDVLTTFNRITAVYLLIAILLMLRKRRSLFILVGAGSLLVLSSLSVMWPMFRSFASLGGYSFESLHRAYEIAFNSAVGDTPLDASINGVFESSNIIVLNWIVYHVHTSIPYLRAEMFVRPATIFLPSFVWADRPPAFGTILGSALTNVEGLALNSTLFGEVFANFPMLWPIALVGFLLILHFAFHAMSRNAPEVGFIGAFVAIALWRFDSSFGGMAIVLTALLTLGVKLLRTRTRPSVRPDPRRREWLRHRTAGESPAP